MNYLVNIDATNNLVLYPQIIQTFQEFSVLDHDELLFVIYVNDIYSPLRQFPEQERIYRACLRIWNDNNPKFIASQKYKVASETYRSLQFNPKAELAKVYQKKIDSTTELIEAETGDGKIKNHLDVINKLKAAIQELEREVLDGLIEEGVLKAGAELSWLENLMRNRELYEAKYKAK